MHLLKRAHAHLNPFASTRQHSINLCKARILTNKSQDFYKFTEAVRVHDKLACELYGISFLSYKLEHSSQVDFSHRMY